MTQAELDQITYNKNFLEKVIIRFDFANEIPEIKNKINDVVVQRIKEILPVIEVQKINNNEIQLGGSSISSKLLGSESEWDFSARDRSVKIAIASSCIYLECNSYESFEKMYGIFRTAADAFFEFYTEVSINRVGLRYINNLKISDIPMPVKWDGYINDKYLCLLKVFDCREYMRAMSILEIMKDDYKLRLQYGVFNPDYPSTVTKKEFIIDIDAYATGIIFLSEYDTLLKKMHTSIQEVFESFLEEKTRGVLNA